jgi:hypothetical protein
MAETYQTSIYKTQPAAPSPVQTQTSSPPTSGGEQYQTPIYKTPSSPPGGGQQEPAANPSWGDWGKVAGNEALMGTIPYLRTQAEAARQRLGPVAAGSADFAGAATSPSQLLNFFGGPEVAGAVHEGVKSYMNQPDWVPSLQGAEKIGADAAFGAATGGMGRAVAAAAPTLARAGVSGGVPLASGGLTHLLFGHSDPYREAANVGGHLLAIMGMQDMLNEGGKAAGSWVKNSPVTQQAIKSLILGGGSAARNAAGPWDQWVPGQ